MKIAVKYIYRTWAYLFARPRFRTLNRAMYFLSLRGLGVLNYETKYLSGEFGWLRKHLGGRKAPVVFDVGANIGGYSQDVLMACPSAVIYAFEPHPSTFLELRKLEITANLRTFNKAVGKEDSTILLYDYEMGDGSSHASVYKGVIESVHRAKAVKHSVDAITLDKFCLEHAVNAIDLLKLDTEGNELECLLGAQRMLSSGRVRAIQFEFNEMNVISGSRFKDFWDLLPEFEHFRLLPGGGLLKIDRYSAINCEIYAYQNIVSLQRSK